MLKTSYIYILANKANTVLYTGVTSNLEQRLHQHKTKYFKNSFTDRYNVNKLVYYEEFGDITEAIAREKQIKAGSRKKKVEIILTPKFLSFNGRAERSDSPRFSAGLLWYPRPAQLK